MNIKIKGTSNSRLGKRLLGVAALFLFALSIQISLFVVNPATAYAAPKDDARKKACEKGVVDKGECEKYFDMGYAEAKKKNSTDQKFICPATDPSPIEAAKLKGCYEGVNFYRAEKGQSVPEGSDIERGTVTAAGAAEACKDESNATNKSACEDGFKAAAEGKTNAEACSSHQAQNAKKACEDGFTKGAQASGTDANQSPDCDKSWSSPLSWIVCPLIEVGTTFTDFVFKNLVEPLLANNPIDSDPSSSTYKAWQGFRTIANIILVLAMLILVFAQTTGRGGGMISAYAVKKMAPRILFAAIAINLSIYLVVAAVDITNIIGTGLGQLLREPFINADTFSSMNLQANAESTVVGGAGIAIGVVAASLLAGLVGSIFSGLSIVGILGTAVGGILFLILLIVLTVGAVSLAVVATVVIRYGLIVFLGLVAPIAIACAILPGTEKYFKSWWSLFSKTLLVYPIIAIIFAMSDIMAAIFLNMQSDDNVNDIAGLTGVFIAIFAVYAPLFLIPFAFKFAGGAMSSLYDFSRKGSGWLDDKLLGDAKDPDSLRGKTMGNLRAGLASKDMSMKAISARVSPTRRLTRSGREGMKHDLAAIRTAYAGKYAAERGQSIFAKAGEQTDEVQMDMAGYGTASASQAAIQDGSHYGYNDGHRDIMRRIAAGEDVSDEDRTKLETRRSQLAMYSAMNDRVGRTQATRSAAANSAAALSYGYDTGAEGWKQAVEIAQSIYGEDNEAEVLNHMNKLQYVAKQVGRSDLAGNVNSTEYKLDRATGSHSLYQLLNGKPFAVDSLIDMHAERLRTGIGTDGKQATDAELKLSAVFLDEMANAQSKGQGTGAVRDAINSKSAVMKAARESYVNKELSKIESGPRGVAGLPDTKIDSVERTIHDPNTKQSVTTRENVATPLNTVEERRAEAKRRIEQEIGKDSRAYSQLDPNLIEDQNKQNQPPDPNNP